MKAAHNRSYMMGTLNRRIGSNSISFDIMPLIVRDMLECRCVCVCIIRSAVYVGDIRAAHEVGPKAVFKSDFKCSNYYLAVPCWVEAGWLMTPKTCVWFLPLSSNRSFHDEHYSTQFAVRKASWWFRITRARVVIRRVQKSKGINHFSRWIRC